MVYNNIAFVHLSNGGHWAHKNFVSGLNATEIIVPELSKVNSRGLRYLNIYKTFSGMKKPLKGFNAIIFEDLALVGLLYSGAVNNKTKIIVIVASEWPYLIFNGFVSKSKLLLYKMLIKKVDLFIAVSNMQRDFLIKLGVKPEKIKVVYPAPNEKVRKELLKIKPNLKSRNIIFVGNIRLRFGNFDLKGVDLLVKAFKEAKNKMRNLKLFIVGGNNESIVSQYSIAEDIIFTGSVKSIADYLKKAALYVHLGKGDAMPISVTEALTAGLPVIVSEYTGSKEFVNKINPKFVLPLDYNKVAKEIVDYFNLSYAEKLRLSKKARAIGRKVNEKSSRILFKKYIEEFLEGSI
ncbi:glycosyltransferase [Candidatus Parvarchaeota archaeon]|nr:glycosyltransferase [Candidatus Parvarchaeota archaeon]